MLLNPEEPNSGYDLSFTTFPFHPFTLLDHSCIATFPLPLENNRCRSKNQLFCGAVTIKNFLPELEIESEPKPVLRKIIYQSRKEV